MRRILIAGTGTEVGKTYVTSALRVAIAARCSVLALKPIESGYQAPTSDARTIGGDDWKVPLHHFEQALSPHLAARLEGRAVDLDCVAPWVAGCAPDSELALVETAGGLFSPLTDDGLTNVDLIMRLRPCEWVLVAADRLGVLHDIGAVLTATTTTLGAPVAVVLNARAADESTPHNAAELSRLHPALRIFSLGHGASVPSELVRLLTADDG